MVNKSLFRALKNKVAATFVMNTLLQSYSYFFPLNEKDVQKKIRKAFSLLIEVAQKEDVKQLSTAIKRIHKELFFNNKKDHC